MGTLRDEIKRCRKEIEQALNGKIYTGEDDNGVDVYEDETTETCNEAIIQAYDYIAGLAIDLADSGVAIERIAEKQNVNIDLQDYIGEIQKIKAEYK